MDDETRDLWVFAYGSLLWNPGFSHVERQPARIRGYHRSLCVYSHVHRGTPERPGLVLGLDRGGACRGLVYRVDVAQRLATLRYLRAREQVTSIYIETMLGAELDDGRLVRAVTYVVDRKHHQYSGPLPVETMVAHVKESAGRSGRNLDYVLASHAKMMELGIRDATLAALAMRLETSAGETLNGPAVTTLTGPSPENQR
ncbi:MAG: gamma-glutamylcyclotransferase [Beijerinckiaceae bacterium]